MGLKGEHQVKVSTRAGIGTYIMEVLSIQRITRRPSPVSKFREENHHFFRAYKSCKLYLKLI